MRRKISKKIAAMLCLVFIVSAVFVPELTLTAAAEKETAVDAAAVEIEASVENAGDDMAEDDAVGAETVITDQTNEILGNDYEDEELTDRFEASLNEDSEEEFPEEQPLGEAEVELQDSEEIALNGEPSTKSVYTGTDDGSGCNWSYDTTTRVLTVQSIDSDARTLHTLTGSDIDTVKNGASKLVLKKVDTIMPGVFKGYKFSTIEFCPELRWIRDNAFEDCLSLSGIDLTGTTLFWIEPWAFKGCINLKTAVFPDSLRQINESAFKGCTALREVDLSNTGVYIINDHAFDGCTFLGKMLFPETLETLGDYAIYKCGSISDSNTEIASRLKELDLRMVKKFGDHAVSENRWLTTISISKKINEVGGSVTSTTFVGNGRAISSANGYWTTYFYGPEDLFNSIPNLKDNPFPKAVICIDPQMMGEAGDCTWKLSYDKKTLTVTPKGGVDAPKLTRILTANVGTDIDDYKKVEKVVIQNGVKILDNALPGFTGVKTVELPDGLITIGKDSFSGCTGLQDITIPASVTTLGEGAFRNCTALTELEIPSNVTSLSSSVCQGCSALTDITFKAPSKVGSIGELAFASCTSLKKISLPDSVTGIANRAFSGCKKLEEFYFPPKLTSIGYSAFDGAFKDSTVDVILLMPATLSKLGTYVFQNCAKIKTVMMNSCALRQIPDGTFYNCTGLEDIYLPDTIEKVGNKAFGSCSKLKTLQLNSVKEFSEHAVEDCSSLASLYISKKITTVAADSFLNNNASKTVYFYGKKTHFDGIPNLSKNTDLLSGKIEFTDKDDRPELVEFEKTVLAKTDNKDEFGAAFHILQARVNKVKKSYIKLKWEKAEGATGYIVYGALNKKVFEKLGTLGAKATSFKHKGLKGNKYYKYIVVAIGGDKGDERIISASPTMVIATAGGKYRNASSVSLAVGNSKLKVGKALKLKGKVISNASKGKKYITYIKVRYESTNPAVATVSKKGKVKAMKKGKCYIYAYAQDGTFTKIRIKVKG